MLIFDEADPLLLSDRREASHSWEVTQVNEMLTWMESHPLPFVCTTNLGDRLDHAALRRFTLKLRFDSLGAVQAARAFRHFFAAEPPRAVPDGLTPGDFATVRRKLALYGDASPGQLVEWLDRGGRGEGDACTADRVHRAVSAATPAADVGHWAMLWAMIAEKVEKPAMTGENPRAPAILGRPARPMRYEKADTLLRLAIDLQGLLGGLSLDDIRARCAASPDAPLSRRTAERLRDAIERIFPQLEQANPGELPKRWRACQPAAPTGWRQLRPRNSPPWRLPSRYCAATT